MVARVSGFVLASALVGCANPLRLDLLAPEPADPTDAAVLDAALPSAELDASLDAGARTGLVLRYDFSGGGVQLVDRAGGNVAAIRGGAILDDSGTLTLDGVDDYVALPPGLASRLSSLTVMAWVQWYGGSCWQRVFDFGLSDGGVDHQGYTLSSLFMTPATCPEGHAAAVQERPPQLDAARAAGPLTQGRAVQVAVTVDDEQLTLYVDGTWVSSTRRPYALSELRDVNCWLGRSQWIQDPFARLRYDEFRLYDRALSAAEIASAYGRGPQLP